MDLLAGLFLLFRYARRCSHRRIQSVTRALLTRGWPHGEVKGRTLLGLWVLNGWAGTPRPFPSLYIVLYQCGIVAANTHVGHSGDRRNMQAAPLGASTARKDGTEAPEFSVKRCRCRSFAGPFSLTESSCRGVG